MTKKETGDFYSYQDEVRRELAQAEAEFFDAEKKVVTARARLHFARGRARLFGVSYDF